MQSEDLILNSGLGQSALRQIALSRHELLARADTAAGSRTDMGEDGGLSVKNAG
jgi:hypothetical protein